MRACDADLPGVEFTGYVDEDDVARLFTEAAITVFPYTSTIGSSGVLHQAGSYGRAAVLPDIGHFSEVIKGEGFVGQCGQARPFRRQRTGPTVTGSSLTLPATLIALRDVAGWLYSALGDMSCATLEFSLVAPTTTRTPRRPYAAEETTP